MKYVYLSSLFIVFFCVATFWPTFSHQEDFVANYQFSVRSVGAFNVEQQNSLQIETQVQGNLSLSLDSKQSSLKVDWNPIFAMTTNGKRNQDKEDILGRAAPRYFFLLLAADGLPKEIRFPDFAQDFPETKDILLNTMKLVGLQLYWRPGMMKGSEAIDIWGPNAFTVRDSGKGYLFSTKTLTPSPSKLQGTGEGEIIFSDGVIERIVLKQKSQLQHLTFKLGQSESDYLFQRKATPQRQKQRHELSGLQSSVVWHEVDQKKLLHSAVKKHNQGWSITKVQEEMEKLVRANQVSSGKFHALSGRLAELLMMDQRLALQLRLQAKQLGTEHPMYDEILRALAYVGCSECQQALRELYLDQKTNERNARNLVITMGFLRDPDLKTEDFLRQIARERTSPVAGSAGLMLGQIAYQLQNSAPDRSLNIYNDYIRLIPQRGEPLKDKQGVMHAMNVIGNSGLCPDYERLARLMESEDRDMQDRAVLSLRFCKDSRVAPTFTRFFLQNTQLRPIILQAFEMRAERDMIESSTFSFFRDWLKEQNDPKEKSISRVALLLRQISLARDEFSFEWEEIASSCDRWDICEKIK